MPFLLNLKESEKENKVILWSEGGNGGGKIPGNSNSWQHGKWHASQPCWHPAG